MREQKLYRTISNVFIKIEMKAFYLYMIKCNDKSLYIGHTDDIENRMNQHKNGHGCGYTATRLPIELVFLEEFETRHDALALEMKIKKWSRVKKEALIERNWNNLVHYSRKIFK